MAIEKRGVILQLSGEGRGRFFNFEVLTIQNFIHVSLAKSSFPDRAKLGRGRVRIERTAFLFSFKTGEGLVFRMVGLRRDEGGRR